MKTFSTIMISSTLLLAFPAIAHKNLPAKMMYNLVYKSPTRGNISCANRVIFAAEEAIDRAKISPKQYDPKQIDLAIYYARSGSVLAKFHRNNLFYQEAQNAIIQELDTTKANILLDAGYSLQQNKK